MVGYGASAPKPPLKAPRAGKRTAGRAQRNPPSSSMKRLSPPQHFQNRPHPFLARLRLFRRLQAKRDRIDIRTIERGEKRLGPRVLR